VEGGEIVENKPEKVSIPDNRLTAGLCGVSASLELISGFDIITKFVIYWLKIGKNSPRQADQQQIPR
jgi:hypothetical protein